MYISRDNKGVVVASSDHPMSIPGNETIQINGKFPVGKIYKSKKKDNLKVALVCNWNLPCGISTYSRFLHAALKKKVKEIKVFSEVGTPLTEDDSTIDRCWERGHSLKLLANKIKTYNPDFIIVQHEYGIFPNAFYFLQFLQDIDEFNYVVALHSVYEHLDKTICTAPIRNAVVHTKQAEQVMRKHGHTNRTFVVPHGCFRFDDAAELWNIFHNPYTVVQFGFGFYYKGVDRALDAIAHLKNTDPKFKNIFYCYLCSENPHNANLHTQYIDYLLDKAKNSGIDNNITIVRGYKDEKIINNYLRTAKIAIFPYKNNPDNTVYGSSGAVRIAMANKIPIIASESHLFDDLEGVVPRPNDHIGLAREIDEIFSNNSYKKSVLDRIDSHTLKYGWDYCAQSYLDAYHSM